MNLLVIRHPEPLGSQGVCYGQSDLSVDPAVLELIASRLRQQLAGSKVDLWLSSPLQRCSQLAARLDPGYQTDPRLLEMNFGDWEGQRWDDIDRTDLDTWSADYINAAPPGGESFMALQQRVASLLADLRQRELSEVAVVSHAGVIRALLSLVLGIPLESTWRIEVRFGALLRLRLGAAEYQNRLLELSGGD